MRYVILSEEQPDVISDQPLQGAIEAPDAVTLDWGFQNSEWIEPERVTPILPPITKRQFQLQMIELDKDDDLEDIIASTPTKEQKKLRAELDANEYHFDSPFVSQLAAALGFSDAEKEHFWREAAQR